jgi:RNA polymerase sigma-70 factor, ECF subfamily
MAAEIAHTFLRSAEELPPPRAHSAARAEQLSPLVASARAGDARTFEEIMLATERKIVATAWRLLGDREDARDAAQETYLRAYKYLARFREGEDFQAWLYRIAVNVCRDAARKRRPSGARGEPLVRVELEEALLGFEGASAAADAEEGALRSQQRALLRRALASLPEKERAAVVLRDVEGLSTEEVARLLGSRPVTVRSQISSARVKLKDYCERLIGKGSATRPDEGSAARPGKGGTRR